MDDGVKLYWQLDWMIFLCGLILVCVVLERSKYPSFIWQTKGEGVVPVERNCAASVSIDFLQRRSRWKPGLGFQVLTPRQSLAPLYNYLLYLYTCIFYLYVRLQQENLSHCGYFCVSFILCLENNIPLHKFLTIFHKKDLYLNDYICIRIITTFIKYMYLRN